jgi:hypothetical protein
VGSVCHIKRFHLGGKHFAGDEEVRVWLRQQSKDFYAVGFNALESNGTSVGGGYVKK